MTSQKPVILIIDKNLHNVLSLKNILANEEYQLHVATDGVCALKTINTTQPDLILLDITMTNKDGHTLCQQLTTNQETQLIPIILFSATYDATVKACAFAMGGVNYIAAPFVADEVLTCVNTQVKLSKLRHQLKQEITERNHDQDFLQKVYFCQEEHVRHRTIALSTANTKLKQEIIKRQRVEQALSESEARYRNVVETQTEFVVRNTPDGVRTFVNSAFCRYWGIPSNEAIGKSFFELLSPNELVHVQEKYSRLTPTTPTETHIQETTGPNGHISWQEWTETGIFDESGRLIEVQAIGRDITEQKQAEQALKESEAQLKGIINSAMDAIIMIDERQRVVLFNPTANEIFGYTADEIIGQPLTTLLPKRSQQNHEKLVTAFSRAGIAKKPMGHDMLYGLHKSGQEFPVEASIAKLALNGKQYYTAILRDITKRLVLEEKFYQAQKMEALGLLASGVAHDFNNLLTPIAIYADLGMRTIENTNKAYQCFQQVYEAAMRAKELTQQILTFSRKHKLIIEPVDINQTIIDISSLLKRVVGKDITLAMNLHQGNPLVQADVNQLGQVLINLTINACDAMSTSGVLKIETQIAHLEATQFGLPRDIPPGSYVLLRVSDTGMGMSDETKQHLFEPFYTTKELGKGTGLGLATVYDIIQRHHGYIQFESEQGHGTIFQIYFPRIEGVQIQSI